MEPKSILLVEDTELARKLARRMLTSLGYEVTVAANADEAFGILKEGARFDMLVTDIVMPGSMDGIELAKRVRKYDTNLPIVFTSGYSTMRPEELAKLNATYITKPYRKVEIASVLDGLLNSVPSLS